MKFIVRQKFTALVNRYSVYRDDETNLVAFAEQKRFTMKEEVLFYKEQNKENLVFSVKAEKVLDVHGKFFVYDQNNKKIGALKKSFKSSLLRSTYELLDLKDNVVAIVQERNMTVAILRRIWDLIPIIGEFIPFFIRYHFDFIDPKSKDLIATYNKTNSFFDYYELDVKDESLIDKVGWQTLVAQAVMLDVMQGR